MRFSTTKRPLLLRLLRPNRRRGPKVMSIAGRRSRRSRLLRAFGSR